MTPTSANVGAGALTISASGSGFIAASVIEWNGSALPTTYVSGTSLTAQVPASDFSTTGKASVTVQTSSPGGGTSSAISFAINTPPNPAPTTTSLSPSSATVGGPAFVLTVTGTQFISTSQVLWNGSPISTTYGSSTSLSAQIPASDLSAVGTASVTVQNPTPGGGLSGSLTFNINEPATNLTVLDLEGSDLTWDPSQKKLYVAVPSKASANPGTITVVDPIAGALGTAQPLTSAASGLAISDDSQYLYAVINGAATIQRLKLPGFTTDIQWTLGTDPTYGVANLAGDVKVEPGAAHTVAVALGGYGSGFAAIFDDGVERAQVAGVGADQVGNSLQWKADGTELFDVYSFDNDSGYQTSVSDNALFTMPVTSNGLGTVTEYNSSFRGLDAHIHLDATTGYVYGDWGEVVNGTNGIPIGNYRWTRSYGGIPLSVVDPTLKRFFTLLEVNEPDGTNAFQIQVFDQASFKMLSTLVIPNAAGSPANFIRWGQAGLAFVTQNGGSGAPGKLYILDGGFVNPSGTLDTAAGTAINPVPTLTGISPLTAIVGSSAITLTVTGRDFTGQPTVYWNGTALQTTQVNGTELSVQIPASDLSSVSQAVITASNSANALPGSNSLPFSVNPAAPSGNQIAVYSTGGNDLVWDANASKIYVSMPGIQGDAGDAIGVVDPVAGTVTTSGFVGSDPARLSIASDGQSLYAALYGENAIEQLSLPDFKENLQWNLGGEDTFSGPYYALDVEAAPGAPQTTAVTLANFDISPSPAYLVIYDGSTPRADELQDTLYPYSSLQWGATATTVYAVDQEEPQGFLVLGVSSAGATQNQHYDGIVTPYSTSIDYDGGTGYVYTDGGQAIIPQTGAIAGSYGSSGILVPDSKLDRVFILGQTLAQNGTSSYTIESFDQAKFSAIGSITIDNVVGKPTAMIRWGSNGLAFTTRVGAPDDFQGTGPGQLYVISGDVVTAADSKRQSSDKELMQPVRRTWGLESNSRRRSAPASVEHVPMP